MSVSIGDTVGDYRILAELGHGGMGRVFKAEHAVTRRVEAIKVLSDGRPDTHQHAARSLREIQLQASLDHPNIAAVHNAFWVGEDLVLVMELIQGRSLRRVLEDGRVSLKTVLDYAGQALSALSYAHEHGVIHRDISPGNVMIGPTGVVKLTDFGLAKGPIDGRLSQSGAPLGTLWYMSPEQVHGTVSDARSDIYSLGAVLYELATRKKPFDVESAFAIMSDQVLKEPTPPIELDPSVPPALNAALLRALEKDPDRRFQTAEEFRQVVAGIQSSANAAETGSRSSVVRSPVFWAAAALVCLVLTTAGAFLSGWVHSPSTATAAATAIPQSTFPLAETAQFETPQPTTGEPAKAVKRVTRKPAKSSPNIFRKALKPIWPLSKHDKPASADHPSP